MADIQDPLIDSLLKYFNRISPLSDAEEKLVRLKFQPRHYRKYQYVLQQGDVCTHFTFVLKGCLRNYKIDNQGNVHIIQFAIEDWWINDLGSFYSLLPSNLNIDALEDTQVLQITYDDLIDLYNQAPKFDRIFRLLVEKAYVRLQNRLLQNISATAEERYYHFVQSYPSLLNRLSQIQIAAHIGVTPEFLSRLRSRLAKS